MLILNAIRFDPIAEESDTIKYQLKQHRVNQDVLKVDWTKRPLTAHEIMQTYLPLVKFAQELGYRVHARIPLVLISRFSYDADPIVFCGHTLNPFAFEKVDVILD